jgi:hypothetical protein
MGNERAWVLNKYKLFVKVIANGSVYLFGKS